MGGHLIGVDVKSTIAEFVLVGGSLILLLLFFHGVLMCYGVQMTLHLVGLYALPTLTFYVHFKNYRDPLLSK